MTDPRPRRREALVRLLDEQGLDGLVVDGGSNIRYLTGFTGSSALVLAARQRTVLVTDFRYATQAPAETGPAVDVRIERADVREGLRQSIGALGLRRVGFDRPSTTIAGLEALREQGGVEWVATTGLVEKLRVAKDAVEIAAVREAVRLALDALEAVLPFIRVGRTELDIAAELEAALRRRGSEWHPFQSIVAAGARSALPHARSTARAVAPGDLLVVDFGAQVDGYCSDITRTFVVGRAPDDRQREVYGVVQQAQARALGGLRAGMSGREADSLARDPIARAGMGEAFGHSLGHGLGLEVHEEPRLSQRNEGLLPAGAVVTVEPGVYFEGWGGVRIEDDAVLRPDGAERLSGDSNDLVSLT